ncbi:DUF3813 domain-containing protein [Bacillus timonensis]|uniref:DUF3813 domain-containing protein n=1 Tax=Bacillus timonensis TaxID=1033734 RepID=A0A4S3PNW8_9BACI|nr:DUF3813 domain-containing protein [Bacillus timonensis]THE11229.1 DUF3813 domain-containing protein [Bacillus timonensis]
MGNRLFQKARETVEVAKLASTGQSDTSLQNAISVAKNALSSAYANSTTAEKEQLRELQNELDQIQ